MFASLVGVIVLIVVGGIVVRRYLMSRIVQPNGKRVAVLESTRLASRQTVHLVQAGTRKYLLAATPEQVSLVADVTEAFGKDEAPIA